MGGTATRLRVIYFACYSTDSCVLLLSKIMLTVAIQVNVLKPSHKSTLQSKTTETPVPDSVSAVHNATNATRDVESEFETSQEGRIREIVMDNGDLEPKVKCTLLLL